VYNEIRFLATDKRMSTPLQVGIIGLGPRYVKRYKAALLRQADRFAVCAVCDQVQQRSLSEAKQLGCAAAAGPTELLERGDVQALLLLEPQWYRLWPLELACKYGKPAFCCAPLARDEAHAEVICQRIEESRVPVVFVAPPHFMPASSSLRELLATDLGPPRLLVCDYVQPWRRTLPAAANRRDGAPDAFTAALLEWCSSLIEGLPERVVAADLGKGELQTLFLRYADERGIQLTCRPGLGLRGGVRLQVSAAHGVAGVELPNRLAWSDSRGEHTLTLRARPPVADQWLEAFWQVVRGGALPQPRVQDSYRVLGWLRAARRSAAEGREIAL
jgi:predicted dehydrogenase